MFLFMTCALGGLVFRSHSVPQNLKDIHSLDGLWPLLLTATPVKPLCWLPPVTWLLGTKLEAFFGLAVATGEKTYFLFLPSLAPDTFLLWGTVCPFHQDLTTFSGLRRFSLFLCYFDKSVDLFAFVAFLRSSLGQSQSAALNNGFLLHRHFKKFYFIKFIEVTLINKICIKCTVL